MVGTLLVPVGFLEATRFLPPIFYTGFIEAMQWVAVGLLILLFLWFRPNGLFPEKPGRFRRTPLVPSVQEAAPE
jgi:branched-chain amino acid transport system permease protein